MMRAPLIAIVLSIMAGGGACAQSSNVGGNGLESCFQSARTSDANCSNPANDPVQRLDCLQKARTILLECLAHVPPEMSAGYGPPPGTVSPELPTGSVLPDIPAGSDSPQMPPRTGLETPTGTASKDKLPGSPKATNGTVPREAPSAVDTPAQTVEIPAKPSDTNWVLSELTSPVDYNPVVTAVIRSTSSAKDGPNTLAIRCLRARTELLIRTEGSWQASRTSQIQVSYQINDEPFVRLQWATSADGKTASYKDDAVGFLRSLPEGARLKINVFDRPGPGQEATFRLSGLDAVRKKIGMACKWAPAGDTMSLGNVKPR